MLNDFTRFIDDHLHIIRGSVFVAGTCGILLLIKRFHLVKVYRHNSEIPLEFIRKSIKLHGVAKSIDLNGVLSVQHTPVLFASKQSAERLQLICAGVQPLHDDYPKYMHKNVVDQKISFIVFGMNNGGLLECEIYRRKRRWLSSNKCLNEKLVKKGLGVVHRGEDLVKHDDRANIARYDKLIDRLLKIEVKLDKKRENRRWKNLTLLQKIKEAYSTRYK